MCGGVVQIRNSTHDIKNMYTVLIVVVLGNEVIKERQLGYQM